MSGGVSAWQLIGECVRGASHVRAGSPNQDAIAWRADSATNRTAIMVVSDGHGSAKCFRSDVGSRLAVNAALRVLEKFASNPATAAGREAERTDADGIESDSTDAGGDGPVSDRHTRLAQDIVREWQKDVDAALEEHPLSKEEMDSLEAKDGAAARQAVNSNPRLAYGATLLAALLTDAYILYLQLGDGDIVTVSDTGAASRPLEHDQRLFANETTSLCARDAWREIRVRCDEPPAPTPALILLSTDGYANSFRTDAGFLSVGSDLLAIIRAEGLQSVGDHLKGWLTETSQGGSGDDITLGILCRMEVVASSGRWTGGDAAVSPGPAVTTEVIS